MARSLFAAAAACLALVHGPPHAHPISIADGRQESVSCGTAHDIVVADAFDRIAANCRVVSLRLSVDTTTGPAQHRTEVEPSAAASGSTVVAVFQVGRFADGAAEAIGFATSSDAGRTWRSGLLPGLTVAGGRWTRASDPVVAYDATHGVWLAASLAFAATTNAVPVSRSVDGVAWSAASPAVEASSPLSYDKEWLTCDNWPASPRRGSCYLQWTDVKNGGVASQVSRDGGLNWSRPVRATVTGFGTQPVVLPDGTLVTVVFANRQNVVLAARSTDGGGTFSPLAQISDVRFAQAQGLRAPPLPSVAVDGAGTIAAVWPDCRFRARCTTDDIAVVTSADGAAWSPPSRAATAEPGTSAVVPGLGGGAQGRFALTYYTAGSALTGVRTLQSLDGAATWSAPRRLDAVPMRNSWLARTDGGRFAGDYIATVFAAGKPVPVFSLAVAEHSQSIFAGVRWENGECPGRARARLARPLLEPSRGRSFSRAWSGTGAVGAWQASAFVVGARSADQRRGSRREKGSKDDYSPGAGRGPRLRGHAARELRDRAHRQRAPVDRGRRLRSVRVTNVRAPAARICEHRPLLREGARALSGPDLP